MMSNYDDIICKLKFSAALQKKQGLLEDYNRTLVLIKDVEHAKEQNIEVHVEERYTIKKFHGEKTDKSIPFEVIEI